LDLETRWHPELLVKLRRLKIDPRSLIDAKNTATDTNEVSWIKETTKTTKIVPCAPSFVNAAANPRKRKFRGVDAKPPDHNGKKGSRPESGVGRNHHQHKFKGGQPPDQRTPVPPEPANTTGNSDTFALTALPPSPKATDAKKKT